MHVQRFYAGTAPKISITDQWLKELGITYDQVLYVGDDLNDLPLIQQAGISACPADACQEVKMAVDIILEKGGGQGCIRELVERLGWSLA